MTATNSAGHRDAFSQHVLIGSIVPSNAGTPQAYGTAALGDTVFCSSGGWKGEPAPTFSYQWYRWNEKSSSRTKIAGATQAVYTVQSADVATNPGGEYLECQVTATNSAGHRDAFSQHVLIGSIVPSNAGTPQAYGTAALGDTVFCSSGGWKGEPAPTFSYQWYRWNEKSSSRTKIAGATQAVYTVQSADVATNPGGEYLECQVTATNSAGHRDAFSQHVLIGSIVPSNAGTPQAYGTAALGDTVFCSSGGWKGEPAPTFSYQWYRWNEKSSSRTKIAGATQAVYTVQSADVATNPGGEYLECQVTATNSAGHRDAFSQHVLIVQVVDVTAGESWSAPPK